MASRAPPGAGVLIAWLKLASVVDVYDGVAVGQRVVQRLDQDGFVRGLFVVGRGRRFLTRRLRAEEEVRVGDVSDELAEAADVGRRLEGVVAGRHRRGRFGQVAADVRVHRARDGGHRRRGELAEARVGRLSRGRQAQRRQCRRHYQCAHGGYSPAIVAGRPEGLHYANLSGAGCRLRPPAHRSRR